ncbi:MAG: isocitrate/isopropylmalate family dehydrogenase [Candidatus Neomarinimicrobiota bacterium]
MKIVLIKGDGIGPEIVTEIEKLITTIGSISDLNFKLIFVDINEDHFRQTGLLIPSQLKQICKDADAIWLGPISDNSPLKDYSESSVLISICDTLGLDLHLKRLKPLHSLQTISTDNILDVLIIQSQFSNITIPGQLPVKNENLEDFEIFTTVYFHKKISELYSFAAQLNESNKRVLLALPEELSQDNSPWIKALTIFSEKNFKIQILRWDKLIFQFLHNPENLDVIITLPPFGQILSRMGAAIEGGLGVAYDFYQNQKGKTALFHVLHPASKRFVGKDAANPLGAFLCLGEMMQFLKYPGVNSVIRDIVEESVLAGWTTRDLGGSMGTCEIGDFICSKMSDKLNPA